VRSFARKRDTRGTIVDSHVINTDRFYNISGLTGAYSCNWRSDQWGPGHGLGTTEIVVQRRWKACPDATAVKALRIIIMIIIIHFLGLAPAGWVAAPDKRADARLGQAPEQAPHHQSDGCHAVPLNAAAVKALRDIVQMFPKGI
jgi:hypothetical protein